MKESIGKITIPTIRFITKQIVSAVAYLHSNYVMHRDLKPDNILICRESKVIKISDLGFARVFTHAITTNAQPANYTFPIQVLIPLTSQQEF
jgi:serine/threonine protein kinase